MALAGTTPPGPPPAAAVSTVALPRTTAVPSTAAAAAAYTTAAQTRTTTMPATGVNPMRPQQPPVQYSPPNRNGLYAVLGFIAVIALVIGGVWLYNSLTKNEEVAPPTTVSVPNRGGHDHRRGQSSP